MENSRIDEFDDFLEEDRVGFINFVTLVKHLMYRIYADDMPKYQMAAPEGTLSHNVEMPQILYRLVSKEPGNYGKAKELKPRYRQETRELSRVTNRLVPVVYKAQSVDAIVRFSIYGDNEKSLLWSTRVENIVKQIINLYARPTDGYHEQIEELQGIKKIAWLSNKDASINRDGRHYVIRDVDYLLSYEQLERIESISIRELNINIHAHTHYPEVIYNWTNKAYDFKESEYEFVQKVYPVKLGKTKKYNVENNMLKENIIPEKGEYLTQNNYQNYEHKVLNNLYNKNLVVDEFVRIENQFVEKLE